MNKPVSFDLAKLLKEKGYSTDECKSFYTKPNSKMFGIDEHYRNYPIKNTPKKLYTVGVHAVLNIKNIYFAPTRADVIMWLLESYHIFISIEPQSLIGLHKNRKSDNWYYKIIYCDRINSNYYDSPSKAYEAGIEYALNNLI